MSYLLEVQHAVDQFRAVQRDWACYGTAESHPELFFQLLVLRASTTRAKIYMPATREDWALPAIPGCHRAVVALNCAAIAVLSLIDCCPTSEWDELAGYLADVCWRVAPQQELAR